VPGGGNAAVAAPIAIDPPLKDFGIVEPGAKLPAVFKLHNRGTTPLRIATTLPSCKCTTMATYAGTVIAPGGTFEMSAEMQAPETPGVKDAKINIVFEGFSKPTVPAMRCEVLLPIKAVEEYVDALKGVTSGVLTVESRDGTPFKIVSSNGAAPSFVGFDPSKDEARSSYTLNWSVAGMPCEGMRLWWIVETDRKDCPILPCRIRHDCTGSKADAGRFSRKWMFKEQIVNAGRIKAGKTVKLHAESENSEPKAGPNKPGAYSPAFKQITGVTSLTKDATVKFTGCTPRGEEEAMVSFDFTPAEGFTGMLYATLRVASPTGTSDIAVVASVEP